MTRLFCLLFLSILSGSAWAANECRDRIDNDGDGWIDRADAISSPGRDEPTAATVWRGRPPADCAYSASSHRIFARVDCSGVDRPSRRRWYGFGRWSAARLA
jgi:hypothetical protein